MKEKSLKNRKKSYDQFIRKTEKEPE